MTDEPSPGLKALRYAEDNLGVNRVYDEACEQQSILSGLQDRLLAARSEKRRVEQTKADLEMEVVEEERRKHHDMSQAQMDKHLKVAFSNNGDIREARDYLSTLAGEIDFLEFEVDRAHQDIKIAVARMEELGGYLQYLAVVKHAEENRIKANQREKDPWA